MFQRFMGPKGQARHVYTDNAGEFAKTCQELGWPQDTSRPHRSETNGIAEAVVENVKEGTACNLGQSGKGWGEAVLKSDVEFALLRGSLLEPSQTLKRSHGSEGF